MSLSTNISKKAQEITFLNKNTNVPHPSLYIIIKLM